MFNQTFTVQGSSLKLMQPGEAGIVSRLRGHNASVLEKLRSLGLLPGSPIQLEQRSPYFIVRSGHNCYTLDDAIVQAIYVRITA